MARQALRGQSEVLSGCVIFVTRLAIKTGVSADEWEAILVLADGLDGNAPSLDRVALLAVGTHLAPVDIRVAIGALRAHVAEHKTVMTLPTGNIGVHA
ncbi:MAG: hypothetical protein ACXVZV_09720, partial [Terriglobales bacterium]